MMKKGIDWKKLIISIIIAHSAGVIGGLFTFSEIPTWYASLIKPPVTPPNWLFSPMWLSLYTLMGISYYFIWRKGFKTEQAKIARALYFIQLGMNALWSIIFFGLHSLIFGLIEIIFLWFVILFTMIEFRAIDKKAGYLLLPYLAWVLIATVLNLSILWINV